MVDECDGPGGPAEQEREQECRPFEERLEQLEEHLEGATESLRSRWAEELAHVHAHHLTLDNVARAEQLEERIAEELWWRPVRLESEFVYRQHVAWAQVCLDSVTHRFTSGDRSDARARVPKLLERAEKVGREGRGAVVLAQSLELAHQLARGRGDHREARGHLERLGALAEEVYDEAVWQPLARVREQAVGFELSVLQSEMAHAHLEQLRVQAARVRASEVERTAFAEALLRWHGQADVVEQAKIEQELGELASRPGAAQEQRRAWTLALEEADRQGRRGATVPLELLRRRAYRGSDIEDLGILFDTLEEELPRVARTFHELIGLLNEMRHIAERPEATPDMRLRFARHWLLFGFNARRYDYGAVANDRSAHQWARESAERGELEGQVLLGRSLAHGRGVDPDRRAAARVLREATARGSDEAQMLLRSLWVERFPWLRHRFSVHVCFGWAMLLLYLLTQPFTFNPWGVLAALALWSVPIEVVRFIARLVSRGASDEREDDEHERHFIFRRQVADFKRRPWRIVRVIHEDGAALAPLLWLGINPATALGAGLVFGLMHYPQYTLRTCLTITVRYVAIALWVLPWAGLWPVAVAHVLYDVWLLRRGLRWVAQEEAYKAGAEGADATEQTSEDR